MARGRQGLISFLSNRSTNQARYILESKFAQINQSIEFNAFEFLLAFAIKGSMLYKGGVLNSLWKSPHEIWQVIKMKSL